MWRALTFTLLVGASLSCEHRNTILLTVTPNGPDAASEINAQISALPPEGGVVDARALSGVQHLQTQLVLSKPVTLLLGAAQLLCEMPGAQPCIRVSRPSHIEMLRASTPTKQGEEIPLGGTSIIAGPAFAGFLISVEDTSNWNTAFGTRIEGGVLDGNQQNANGIHIQNQFGVQVSDVNIVRPNIGVELENTDRLWTEGSSLNNLWIFDPRTAGIDMRATGTGSTSVANAMWQRIYINLYTSGSVGVKSAGVFFSNSRVNLLKVWMSSGNDGQNCSSALPVTLTGMHIGGPMIGTTFANMNVEALSCPGSNLTAVNVDPSIIQPTFENLIVQGTPLPTVRWGRSFQNGDLGVNIYNSASAPNIP